MKYRGEEKKVDLSLISILRLIGIFCLGILAYGIALFPPIFCLNLLWNFLDFGILLHLLFLSIALMFVYFIFVISVLFSTAFFINIFHLKYDEGEYGKSLRDKTTFKWILFFTLYYPTYRLLNIFVIPQLKAFYLLLVGCKIGKNVYLAGEEWIADPCVIEIGENTMIGGRTIISGHLAEDKLVIKKVKIGKNCLIGGDSFIMPGVITEENVVIAAKSLVTKNKKLLKGKIYMGIPAKEKKNNIKQYQK